VIDPDETNVLYYRQWSETQEVFVQGYAKELDDGGEADSFGTGAGAIAGTLGALDWQQVLV